MRLNGILILQNLTQRQTCFRLRASADGLSAFTHLLRALPKNTGMAFILVQHLDPKHVSLLAELMGRVTSMPVVEISDATRVEPNHIYVMPPNVWLGAYA